jgi:hypothetical protein
MKSQYCSIVYSCAFLFDILPETPYSRYFHYTNVCLVTATSFAILVAGLPLLVQVSWLWLFGTVLVKLAEEPHMFRHMYLQRPRVHHSHVRAPAKVMQRLLHSVHSFHLSHISQAQPQ